MVCQSPPKLILSDFIGVAFYFSRIGDDKGAKALIEGLDNDELLGPWIDCFPGV